MHVVWKTLMLGGLVVQQASANDLPISGNSTSSALIIGDVIVPARKLQYMEAAKLCIATARLILEAIKMANDYEDDDRRLFASASDDMVNTTSLWFLGWGGSSGKAKPVISGHYECDGTSCQHSASDWKDDGGSMVSGNKRCKKCAHADIKHLTILDEAGHTWDMTRTSRLYADSTVANQRATPGSTHMVVPFLGAALLAITVVGLALRWSLRGRQRVGLVANEPDEVMPFDATAE